MIREGIHLSLGHHLTELCLDHGVVLPEDEGIFGCQIIENAELGIDIVLHLVVVAVEMVGRDIEKHGHIGLEIIHILKLET